MSRFASAKARSASGAISEREAAVGRGRTQFPRQSERIFRRVAKDIVSARVGRAQEEQVLRDAGEVAHSGARADPPRCILAEAPLERDLERAAQDGHGVRRLVRDVRD